MDKRKAAARRRMLALHEKMKNTKRESIQIDDGRWFDSARVTRKDLGVSGPTLRNWEAKCPFLEHDAGLETYRPLGAMPNHPDVYYCRAERFAVKKAMKAMAKFPKVEGFVSVHEVADEMGCSISWVYVRLKKKKVKVIRRRGKLLATNRGKLHVRSFLFAYAPVSFLDEWKEEVRERKASKKEGLLNEFIDKKGAWLTQIAAAEITGIDPSQLKKWQTRLCVFLGRPIEHKLIKGKLLKRSREWIRVYLLKDLEAIKAVRELGKWKGLRKMPSEGKAAEAAPAAVAESAARGSKKGRGRPRGATDRAALERRARILQALASGSFGSKKALADAFGVTREFVSRLANKA